jgi:hypothetical protein
MRTTHYIEMEEFKNTANAALKAAFKRSSYDLRKGLFFNWRLKTPEAGSLITIEMKLLF